MSDAENKNIPAFENTQAVAEAFKNLAAALSNTQDPNALIQEVLRESYLQTTEDLRFYAEKVRYFNQTKKALRDYLNSLREFKTKVISAARAQGTNLCSGDQIDVAALEEIIVKVAHPYETGPIALELCLPNRVPSADVTSLTQLEDEIARWEAKLNSIGDDAQLANVDLQNTLQKQQQTLQMMSNISKMLFDTAMSVIRKMGG
jgi:hypothetical protein